MEIIDNTIVKLSVSAEIASQIITGLNKSKLIGKTGNHHDVFVY